MGTVFGCCCTPHFQLEIRRAAISTVDRNLGNLARPSLLQLLEEVRDVFPGTGRRIDYNLRPLLRAFADIFAGVF